MLNNANSSIYSVFVKDLNTHKVIYSYKSKVKNYPASLTKLMTLYILFDQLKYKKLTLRSKLKVSYRATWAAPSKLGLRAGSYITVKDAILSTVTKSANDVAIVIAENIAGSTKRFAKLMNKKARLLHMYNTHFSNPSGLFDYKNYTTAQDISKLSEALYKYRHKYYHYFSVKKFTYGGRTFYNHNKLLFKDNRIDGMKTGYTYKSGFNMSVMANNHHHRLLIVVLGARTSDLRNKKVENLVNASFRYISHKHKPKRYYFTAINKIKNPHKKLYSLQVGAYKSKIKAKKAIYRVHKKTIYLNRNSKFRILNKQHLYKAVFVNLSRGLAKKACNQLRRHNNECFIY